MRLLLLAVSMAFLPSAMIARPVSCDERRVFAAVRMATGGSRWETVKEVVADGKMVDAGGTGTIHTARDTTTGRSTFVELLDQGRVAYIYDGHSKWERDQGLGVHALDAPDSVARAITTAYFDRNAFWKRATDTAEMRCLPASTENGAVFDVVRIAPRGGNPIDVWVDRMTHLIDRTVQQLPTTLSTTRYMDYRESGGLILPFVITQRFTDTFGNPATATQTIARYRLLRAARNHDFSRPPDPTNGRILGGSKSATIPFAIEYGVIVFQAMIDTKGPFAFAFDPGAQGTLTSVASRSLGLRAGTVSPIAHVRIGKAEIDRVDVAVYGGKPSDVFERDKTRTPIAGALGPELLDRFAVRVDYARRTMTLTPLRTFRFAGKGVALPFTLQEDDDIPLVAATIDGHPGRIQYDVRAPGSFVLFAPFLAETQLSRRYHSGRGTVSRLELGGKVLTDVRARFMTRRAGKFASRTEAGLAGYGVLSHFVTTLDYKHRIIYFESN